MNWYQCTQCKNGFGFNLPQTICPICEGELEEKTLIESAILELDFTRPITNVVVSKN